MAAIDQLLDIAINCGASDLHLTQGQVPRVRIHGDLLPLEGGNPLDESALRAIMGEICDTSKWSDFERTGDLNFTYTYEGKARFRTNYNKQNLGYGAVYHIIPLDVLSLDDLYAPAILKSFSQFSSGLVLITGPPDSGKSTTIAAIINEINANQAKHILTIENPIEFIHHPKRSTVLKREIGTDIDTYANAISAASRQDVDVLLIGEMHEPEAITMGVAMAETDTLVFGSMHTNNATKSVDRLFEMTPPNQHDVMRSSLAVSLQAVCTQILLKRADGQGRLAAHEILLQVPTLSSIILEGKTNMIPLIIETNKNRGMQLMDDCIESYLKQQFIPLQEAITYCQDKDRFQKLLRNM